MSRSPLALLVCLLVVACAPPAPPTVAAPAPAPAPLQVAGAADRGAAEGSPAAALGEPFVEDADPGPVPVHAGDPSWGQADAPVTVVEYADFQCPFCARAATTLAELRRQYGPERLRIVWKDWPLPFHPRARPAALVARRAFERRGNDGFWRVHDAFYGDLQNLDARIADEAARLGLSADDLDALARTDRERARFDAAEAEAKRVGVTGTPAFFVNGVFLSGSQPVDKFTAIIDEQLVKAAALAASGTPRRRVYVELTKAQWAPRPPAAPAAAQDDGTVWRVPIGRSPVRGKPTALVTVVELADFQCPFCARVEPTVKELQARYGDRLRLVFKENPLPFHKNAAPAAELALEARAQRGDAGFWRAHDLLLLKECAGNPAAASKAECERSGGRWIDHQQDLGTPALLTYASALGLDVKRVEAALAKKTHAAEIEADQDLADDFQANGTPHFFINGRRLVGAQPLEKFVQIVDEELAKAEALVREGVGPSQVYERLVASGKTPPQPEKKGVAAPTRANPSRGPAGAKVVVQMFADFQCPFCARVRGTVDELSKLYPGKLRVVWRNLPLPMHADAELAAEAAMEAFHQKGDEGFWAMFELLYAGLGKPGALSRPTLERYGAELGLDPVKLADALDRRTHAAVIAADAKAAADAGISGTPAFVVNGYFISGAQPLAKFKKVVSLALSGR